jgi:hypothetical protein
MFLLPSTKSSHLKIDGFERPAVEPVELPEPVLVRHAGAADEQRIRQLAQLDARRVPAGPYLVAELGGETIAAISMSTADVVADPFRRTIEATELLRMRSAQIAARERQLAARRERQLQAVAA